MAGWEDAESWKRGLKEALAAFGGFLNRGTPPKLSILIGYSWIFPKPSILGTPFLGNPHFVAGAWDQS